jgi:hypothetical protein
MPLSSPSPEGKEFGGGESGSTLEDDWAIGLLRRDDKSLGSLFFYSSFYSERNG